MKPYITDAFQDGRFVLRFQVEGSALDRLGGPLYRAHVKAYGLPKSQTLEAAWLFRLELSTGWNVDFSSACTGIGGWQEVGSLNLGFTQSTSDVDGIEWSMTSLENFQVISVERLIYEDADVYAESGIVLTDSTHGEIVVAAGAAPGSVSVSLPSSKDALRTEFDFGQLERRPL